MGCRRSCKRWADRCTTCVRGPTPPVANPPPIVLAQADPDGNDVEIAVGQQFVKQGAPGEGGGGKGKGKGAAGMLKRVSDGQLVEAAKADGDAPPLRARPRSRAPASHPARPLADERYLVVRKAALEDAHDLPAVRQGLLPPAEEGVRLVRLPGRQDAPV